MPEKQDKVQYSDNICEPVKKAAYYNINTKYYHSKVASSFVLNARCLIR
jgi:hypothetical protein